MKLLSGLSLLLCLSAFGAYASDKTKDYDCDGDYCKFSDKVDALTYKTFKVTCTSADYPDATELTCSTSNELADCDTSVLISEDKMECKCYNRSTSKAEFEVKQSCS